MNLECTMLSVEADTTITFYMIDSFYETFLR